ncbi:MAG: sigma-54 dependent transcriptional regulator [Proteobacteria bacterium]|nr:sigma-54 dependent transcriptional regulator [Pseudomonadota bacterium]
MSPAPRCSPSNELCPALTILSHPRVELISSRVFVHSRVELSRNTPVFSQPGLGSISALDDRFLSRKPVIFTARHNGVEVDPRRSRTQVEADGQVLTDPTFFDIDRLQGGVTLCLSKRITLLLHRTASLHSDTGEQFGLIGNSAAMNCVRRDIATVASVDIPVLIRGESGTGKELIARAIHQHSTRTKRHYEAVNMATVSPSLAGSELFGHVKGAFTGADRNHEGCFARADRGTLFLDEVGDTPVDIQAQLLRVLETSDMRPVGASTSVSVDVRIISATDVNLDSAIAGGGFRQALLQRLAGFQIHVPPLRERREDIGALFYFFVRAELEALGQVDLLAPGNHPWLPAAVVARLARYNWPGNVRQLRNIARQLVIAGRDKSEICSLDDLERLLPPSMVNGESGSMPPIGVHAASGETGDIAPAQPAPKPAVPATRYRDPSEVSEDELLAALRDHSYRLAATAKALKLSRTSLYAVVDQSSRVRKASDLSAAEITAAMGRTGGKLADAAMALEVSTHALKLRIRALGMSR